MVQKNAVRQKTFWHLLSQRRMPNDYEIVTSKLLLNTGEGFTGKRFELDVPLRQWYEKYQQGSPLVCSSWEKFRDPRETTYTKYTELQMTKEIFVDGILEEIEATGYDRKLSASWLQLLSTVVAPFRYPGHALMMIAAYVAQMAPGGRIVVAAAFQAADEARRVERLAYRIRQIQLFFPGFADDSKYQWEKDPHWQPLRQFVEQLLVTYDWGEAFVALNLVLKPMIDELFLKHTSDLALGQGDHLLGRIFYSLNEDCHWQREWSRALIQIAITDTATNRNVIQAWVDKWYGSALNAVEAFSPLFEERSAGPLAPTFHNVGSQIDAFCAEFLRSMDLQASLFTMS
jgi:toluene monooxygenase system protein E